MRVLIDLRLLRGFLRRAKRAFPNEYMESLWGYARRRSYAIAALGPVTSHTSSTRVEYEEDDLEDRPAPGLKYLGTLHTHPGDGWDASPSETDWCSSENDGDLVIGICRLWRDHGGRLRHDLRLWPPVKPYPITIKNLDKEPHGKRA